MRDHNKGLTVKLNFWPQRKAQRPFSGQAINARTKAKKMFNTSAELIAALTNWNGAQTETGN